MKANRIERFGPPEVIQYVEVDRPTPKEGEVLVRVKAAGVGPWDGWVRGGHSVRVDASALPVTLGSDIAGVVEAVGSAITQLAPGDEVFGVTNGHFTGGYAEFAVADGGMVAKRPRSVSFAEAASIPVVAVTAWQMLFDHAKLETGQSVLVLGASGNVGAFAVQLASAEGVRVVASGRPDDSARLRSLGAHQIVEARAGAPDLAGIKVDAVIDTVGGELQHRALEALKSGGTLVSAVSALEESLARSAGVKSVYFIVEVTTTCLARIAALVDSGSLVPRVGLVLPLSDARIAHEMLEAVHPMPRGKIVLSTDQSDS
ncbi:MAG: NADP-dependent oxidoreductase [Burkholderiales bacterium]